MGSLVLINSNYPTDWCCKNTWSGIIFWKPINPRKYQENCEENHVGFGGYCGRRHLTANWLAIITNLPLDKMTQSTRPALFPCLYLGRILIGLFEILMSPDRFLMRPTYLTQNIQPVYYAFLLKLSSSVSLLQNIIRTMFCQQLLFSFSKNKNDPTVKSRTML